MKILIIEDETQLAEALNEILVKNHYCVDCAYDGNTGLELALSGVYDLLILDIMLPGQNGYEIASKLRNDKKSIQILMLSAKSQTYDKVKGLDLGADDYLTKPFSTQELLARVRALSRRKGEYLGDIVTYKDLELDKKTLELTSRISNKKIMLGVKEYQILDIMFKHPSVPVPKDKLIEKIWGFDFSGEYNTVEVYISFLRKKIAQIESKVEIKALRGIGYCLEFEDA